LRNTEEEQEDIRYRHTLTAGVAAAEALFSAVIAISFVF